MFNNRWIRPARFAPATLILLVGLGMNACSSDSTRTTVRVASTTSLYDTGLLDELVSAFAVEHPGYSVQVVAVGTGQALALGARRDADLVFVHAPEREAEFMAAGYGLRRTTLMRNDFAIAGPETDPAGVSQATDGPDALRKIAAAGAPFASRGDDSGTHIREQSLWIAAGGRPDDGSYLEVGQGMGSTLLFAAERRAYVLTDWATLTVLRGNGVDLIELFTGGEQLQNLYSLMTVAGAAEPDGAATVRQSPVQAGRRMNPFAEAWQLLTHADPYVMAIVVRSLAISGSALVLATIIGLPIGALIGLSSFRLRVPAIAIVNTGLALPPVVAGLAVYLLLSRSGPLGNLELLFTPVAMGIAQVALAGPYIAAVTLAGLEALPTDIGLQAKGLGATRLQAAVLQLREIRTSLVAAIAAGFGAIISEVGAAMIVGGNILGETRVMTTTIVLETRRGNFGVAIALGVVLLVVALLVNVVLTSLGARSRRPIMS